MQNQPNILLDDIMKNQYLTFAIGNEDYGIEIAYVKEIIKMQPYAKVPHMPAFIEGLINLRGDLIGMLDVRKRFALEPKAHDEETCIIVLIVEDYLLGIVVDAVHETVLIDSTNIAPPPSAKLNFANQFIRNIGSVTNSDGTSEVKLLIDIGRFLAQD